MGVSKKQGPYRGFCHVTPHGRALIMRTPTDVLRIGPTIWGLIIGPLIRWKFSLWGILYCIHVGHETTMPEQIQEPHPNTADYLGTGKFRLGRRSC